MNSHGKFSFSDDHIACSTTEITANALDLIYGGWRSRILHTGVELGVFDRVAKNCFKRAETVAREIGVDAPSFTD
jgi:hypothetical protein